MLLALAFVVRIWRFDGPYEHFDEPIAVEVSQHLGHAPGWDINWREAVPELMAGDQYNFSAYLYATHFFRRTLKACSNSEWWTRRGGLLAHRLFSAVCGTAAVGFVLLAGWRLGGPGVGFAAGLLAGLNPQLVQDAHYARPEAFMTLLFAAALWLGLCRLTAWRLGLLGWLVGLAAATKASNALLLVLAVPPIWAEATENTGCWWRPDGARLARLGFFAIGGGALGWGIGVPYALVHWPEYLSGLRTLSGQYHGSHPPHSLPDYGAVWPLLGNYYVTSQGWPLLLATVAGGAWLAVRRAGQFFLLLVVPLALSIWLFGSQRVFFERNLSTVLPAALLLAALGLAGVFQFLRQEPARAVVFALAVLLASVPGDRVLLLFLGSGIDGGEQANEQAFRKELAREHPGVRTAVGSLFSPAEFSWLDGELLSGGGELLYVIQDFNDPYKPAYLPELNRRYQAVPVAEYRGTFADYPVSALVVFHGHRLIAYRLRAR